MLLIKSSDQIVSFKDVHEEQVKVRSKAGEILGGFEP